MTQSAKDGTPRLETDNANLRKRGYRGYVGGNAGQWEPIGRLQFDFMKSQGLVESSVLLDIACGSLRAGRFFIPFLDPGSYLGIDIESDLIEAGLRYEIDQAIVAEKSPEFVVDANFGFRQFSRTPDFAIANSLFTHLVPADIERCLTNFSAVGKKGATLFATFFQASKPVENPTTSDAHKGFRYTTRQMKAFGRAAGLRSKYIGDWNHPRGQKMMRYVCK